MFELSSRRRTQEEEMPKKAAGRKPKEINYCQLRYLYIIEKKSCKDIAKHFKVSISTIYKRLKETGLLPTPMPGAETTKDDCRKCIYSGSSSGDVYCNYLSIVGHSRGCSARACTVMEKKKKSTRQQ